ncbi:MAG TPA: phosphoglycerate kinase [Candidatus Dormibacteraeota bacterium]|nr:phosphoglycerate kinase [Candidatus Dormibacteraeota bacterium]
MKLRTVRDLDVKNKRVLLRVDYNVPISDGIVGDPLRIRASFDTIRYLLSKNCSIVLISHMGRPKGKKAKEFSLCHVAQKASTMLGHHIGFVEDCIGRGAAARAAHLKPGEIIMLENLRFHKEEEANDPKFAKELAELADVYIDDAFAAVHRAHASTVGVTKYLPAAAGLLVEREVKTITEALEHPAKPLVAVVGGAKVSTKIDTLNNLMKYADKIAIGGAMANTFLAAQGKKIGKSKHEADRVKDAKKIIASAKREGVELVIPTDVIVAKSLTQTKLGRLTDLNNVEADDYIVDLGPKTVAAILNPLDFHGSVIWNGPLGVAEIPAFAHASLSLAHNIIESGAKCIIGGGDTAAFVDDAGLHDKFAWVSTGGGASLELMSGQKLPGLKALQD